MYYPLAALLACCIIVLHCICICGCYLYLYVHSVLHVLLHLILHRSWLPCHIFISTALHPTQPLPNHYPTITRPFPDHQPTITRPLNDHYLTVPDSPNQSQRIPESHTESKSVPDSPREHKKVQDSPKYPRCLKLEGVCIETTRPERPRRKGRR